MIALVTLSLRPDEGSVIVFVFPITEILSSSGVR
jgi:hypothetical protein